MTPPGRDRYALMGQPVAHSQSPWIHRTFARATGADIDYDLIEVSPAEFPASVRAFFDAGGSGLNVTLPHKPAACALATALTARARLAGAVNTLKPQPGGGLLGDNTDGAGLLRDLTVNLGFSIAGARIVLLGAGGAARGVLGPLLAERPEAVYIANRTHERAEEVARAFSPLGPLRARSVHALEGWQPDLVINSTSAGLSGRVPDLPAPLIGLHTFCYDLSYARTETPFTSWCRRCGATRVANGWGMLVEQAAEAFLLWRGVRPPTDELLTRPGASLD